MKRLYFKKYWSSDGLWWQDDPKANAKGYVYFSLRKIISHDNLRMNELIIWRWRFAWGWN